MLSQQIRDEIVALKKLCAQAGVTVPRYLDSKNVRVVTLMRCEYILKRKFITEKMYPKNTRTEQMWQSTPDEVRAMQKIVFVQTGKKTTQKMIGSVDVRRLAAGDYE